MRQIGAEYKDKALYPKAVSEYSLNVMTNQSAHLKVKNLTLSRGENLLIENLSFTMDAGDIVWVAGTNGIGKTTLLRCIAGLLRPESGQVLWKDHSVHKHMTGATGYQGHKDAHKTNLGVAESLSFWQKIYGSAMDIDDVLREVGLAASKQLRIKSLSAGQSRRLALARLKLQNAKLWILDEPAASMDMEGQKLIDEMVKSHTKVGGLALIASHTAPRKISENTRLLRLGGQ